MAAVNPYQQYQEQSIMTASPGELTLMLYNGCIKFIKQAKLYIEEKDIEKANNAIIRAQDIIYELMSTLNMDYEISNNMMALYDYMNRRLIDANISKDIKVLDEVLNLTVEFRDTWMEVIKKTRNRFMGIGVE
jgi:flagellar biosynthetic protein FliS